MAVATLWQLLERAKIGPCSLMQGNDMALRFRVGTEGESILTGLRNASGEPLGVAAAPAVEPAAEK